MTPVRTILARGGRVAFSVTCSVLMVLAAGLPALACSVCFGDPESPQTQGMNSAILFLMGVIGSVLAAFASMFMYWVARSRRMAITSHKGVEL